MDPTTEQPATDGADDTEEADDTGAAEQADGATAPATDRLVRPTIGRFLRAEALACVLYFLLLVMFAMVGLGQLAFVPSLVIALSVTARLTGIRHVPSLLAIGVLAFVVVPMVSIVIEVMLLMSTGA